ncbi:hypothetical protein ACFFF5_13265 [Lederbergia wuyishanensis]|uniref:DUF4367 domain-containing protein n=1 Tax=Lederbergia wuyishanensis TaxID=1347903 RepID=A0ABU0D544_9BACI|nr:hypothetical protein [Lederbergia wuyishanensis]MCJ8009618.1 hypothetical protein [Lederbergia wuyishanensis]MDQ0343527.1 hypothetical protein [Lederbergia wuyishanensis]
MDKQLLNGKRFPRYELNNEQRSRILEQLNSNSSIQKHRISSYRFMPILSGLALLIIFTVISAYSYSLIKGENLFRLGAGNNPYENFTIDLPSNVNMEKQEDGTIWFIRNGEYVGGLKVVTEKEMNMNIESVFETEEMDGMPYPTIRKLNHVKTDIAIQINHFYVNIDGKTEKYDVYFHWPAFELKEAIEIMRSFQIHE